MKFCKSLLEFWYLNNIEVIFDNLCTLGIFLRLYLDQLLLCLSHLLNFKLSGQMLSIFLGFLPLQVRQALQKSSMQELMQPQVKSTLRERIYPHCLLWFCLEATHNAPEVSRRKNMVLWIHHIYAQQVRSSSPWTDLGQSGPCLWHSTCIWFPFLPCVHVK